MAESSIGVQLRYSTDGGTSYTSAGCILTLDFSGITVDFKESTCLSQTTKFKTFFPTFADAGEFTADLDWSKTGWNTLLGQVGDDLIKWQIVVPDGTDIADPTTCTRLTFDGGVQKLGIQFAQDGDRIKAPVTVKLSGAPTLTIVS